MRVESERAAATAEPVTPHRKRAWYGEALRKSGLLVFLVLVIVVFSILKPNSFLTRANLITLLTTEAIPLTLAMAIAITLRLRDLDVSFAAVMIASASVGAKLMTMNHGGLAEGIVAAIVVGLVFGALNGTMVAFIGLPSFVATLGTLGIAEGVSLGVTNSQIVGNVPAALTVLQGGPGGIPWGVYIVWGIFLAIWLIFDFTTFGRLLLFIGGNRNAAVLIGLRVRMVRFVAYLATGGLFGAAGVILIGMLGVVDPTSDAGYLLGPLAAVFLGTTVFQLGRFNAWGIIVALYTLAVISMGLQILGASSWVGDVFQGAALIIAIAISHVLSRGAAAADFSL